MINSITDTFKLNDGVEIPGFGLGVYLSKAGEEAYNSVRIALDLGYRHIDTAALYYNEEDVGKAVRDSGIPRDEIFITTKLWPLDFGDAEIALNMSLSKLGMEYVDLYLLHWPGTNKDLRCLAWDKVVKLKSKGLIRSIGVSNFLEEHLNEVIEKTGVVPSNNQIELHPWYPQLEMRDFCKAKDITVTSWGPIFHGHLDEEPLVAELGEKYGKTPAQITLRWHIQNEVIIIPKSTRKERIEENAKLFDFSLLPEDMERINALNSGKHFGFDPLTFSGKF
jgi:diketogulonate reductase-like aldo/keto reductase